MAKDTKYGEINVPGIPANEPVVVFRARDAFAVAVLRQYQELRLSSGDREGAQDLELTIKQFEAWPEKRLPT